MPFCSGLFLPFLVALFLMLHEGILYLLQRGVAGILSTSRWSLYSFETSCIVFLISSMYSHSVKKLVFNFQKPGPLGLVVVLILKVIIQ